MFEHNEFTDSEPTAFDSNFEELETSLESVLANHGLDADRFRAIDGYTHTVIEARCRGCRIELELIELSLDASNGALATARCECDWYDNAVDRLIDLHEITFSDENRILMDETKTNNSILVIPVVPRCTTSNHGTALTDSSPISGNVLLNQTIDDAERYLQENNKMSKDTPDENRSRCTDSTKQGASIDDVLQIGDGDAIAVRAEQGEIERIIAGRAFDPASKSEIEETLEESNRATSLVAIDANLWWDLEDGTIKDRSDELVDRPPYQDFLDEPPKDAPLCSLAGRTDSSVILIIPMPVYRRSRIYYYAPDPFGTLVALDDGDVVDPETLVPAGYGPTP